MYFDRAEAYTLEDLKEQNYLKNNIFPHLRFLKVGICLGLLDGDHYREFKNGLTSTFFIAQSFKVPYLGNGQALLFLVFENKKTSNILSIHVHHGKKGIAQYAGSDLMKFEHISDTWENVDILIRGHSHQVQCKPIGKHVADKRNLTFSNKEVWLMNSGSARNSFVENETDYAEVALYRHQPLRFPNLQFKVDNDLNITFEHGRIV
jgi:hypothetical protein